MPMRWSRWATRPSRPPGATPSSMARRNCGTASSRCRRAPTMGADTLAGLATDVFFDLMAIRLDPAKAAGQSMVLNWHFTDRAEKLVLTLKHCTLTPSHGRMVGRGRRLGHDDARHARRHRAAQDHRARRRCSRVRSRSTAIPRGSRCCSRMLEQPAGFMFDILTPGEGRSLDRRETLDIGRPGLCDARQENATACRN